MAGDGSCTQYAALSLHVQSGNIPTPKLAVFQSGHDG